MRYVLNVLAHKRQEVLVELVGDIGGAGIRKRWAAAVTAIGEQRELRHYENLAVNIGKCQVGLAVLILVNAQAAELAPQLIGLGARVAVAHAQQHQIAAPNLSHTLAVDRHAGVEHTLHHRTHGLLLARQFGG